MYYLCSLTKKVRLISLTRRQRGVDHCCVLHACTCTERKGGTRLPLDCHGRSDRETENRWRDCWRRGTAAGVTVAVRTLYGAQRGRALNTSRRDRTTHVPGRPRRRVARRRHGRQAGRSMHVLLVLASCCRPGQDTHRRPGDRSF